MHFGTVAHVCLLLHYLFQIFMNPFQSVSGQHGEIGEIVRCCCRAIPRWTPTPPVRSHMIGHCNHVSN